MAIEINGVREFRNKMKAIADIKKQGKDIVRKVGNKIEREAKKQAPVNTGALRNSIKSTIRTYGKGAEAKIGPSVSYASHVYYGTGSQRGGLDAGYTTGRVRAGQVARGIGGIRPNKFMKRASDRAVQENWLGEEINKRIKNILK